MKYKLKPEPRILATWGCQQTNKPCEDVLQALQEKVREAKADKATNLQFRMVLDSDHGYIYPELRLIADPRRKVTLQKEKRTKLLDHNGHLWTYHHKSRLLKLDDDDSRDGGYHIDSLEKAKDFLEENY